MNDAAIQILVDGFLKGGFDVFEALIKTAFTYTIGDSTELEKDDLTTLLGSHPVALQGNVQGGGMATLLLTMDDATKLCSEDATPAEALDDAALASLKEIADGFLDGGVTNLSERLGEEIATDSIEVVVYTPEQAAELLAALGEGAVGSSFTFESDPTFNSSGYLLTDAPLEARVPKSQLNSGEALVSDDEMKDILSGFSPSEETGSYAGSGDSIPENMEIVLGIDLTATARLGKVEMPISELLSLGAGSIIEVGHLVDEPVELLVNGHLIARGDVVVVDEKFGLRITEIISPRERIESFR
jgi:flagellar motor switch protein FliN